ncbi:MAG: hypothetical protein CEE42_00255 [Promethearchaeota archaeon Loki_b31]|nr:MAG: hypothetical protein CEE42_00255 [Candidatus Lokiarchaeota archaeon Loki_b31]
MEKSQSSELNDFQINLNSLSEELEQRKEDLIKELNIPGKIETSSEPNAELGDIIGDIFYKSMKNFFEVGFKLAESLNLEFNTENQDE